MFTAHIGGPPSSPGMLSLPLHASKVSFQNLSCSLQLLLTSTMLLLLLSASIEVGEGMTLCRWRGNSAPATDAEHDDMFHMCAEFTIL